MKVSICNEEGQHDFETDDRIIIGRMGENDIRVKVIGDGPDQVIRDVESVMVVM